MLPTQRIHGYRMTPTVQHKHNRLVFAALLHFSTWEARLSLSDLV